MRAFMVRHQTPVLLIVILAVVAAISDIGSLDTLQVTLTEMLIRVLVVRASVCSLATPGSSRLVKWIHVRWGLCGGWPNCRSPASSK